MHIEGTSISGLKLLHLRKFEDRRGIFLKPFNAEDFCKNGLAVDFKEHYFSVSAKNVIRGMHFQRHPAQHVKVVFVNQGSILDVVLDVRDNSPTYGQIFSIEMNMKDTQALYLAPGLAHGFLSLEDHTIVSYMQTSVYNPIADSGVRYDSFDMKWPILNPILSERDLGLPIFERHLVQ